MLSCLCRSIESVHVKTNLVHKLHMKKAFDTFQLQMIMDVTTVMDMTTDIMQMISTSLVGKFKEHWLC